MNVDYKSECEVTSAAAKAATGRTLDEWYAELDARGGSSVGRRVHTERAASRNARPASHVPCNTSR